MGSSIMRAINASTGLDRNSVSRSYRRNFQANAQSRYGNRREANNTRRRKSLGGAGG